MVSYRGTFRHFSRIFFSASLLSVLVTTCTISAKGQTLFTYGKHKVSKEEFLHAYHKNNPDSADKVSYDQYLELYTRFKLKVQAALDLKMDTLTQQIEELRAFRNQLAESFLKEDDGINMLIDEAAERSLKDIHLSHIFISLSMAADDSVVASAKKTIDSAYHLLQSGVQFDKVAAGFNTPELGWITCFTLPYDLENIAYSTPVGKFSAPVRTRAGFIILKNDGERKAVGKIRVAQILFAVRPKVADHTKEVMKLRADSVYQALSTGADFLKLEERYNDDNVSYKSEGEIPDFGVGEYEPMFESMAFALKKDSDITKPFETSFGYHILKRLHTVPVIEDKTVKEYRDFLKEKIQQDERNDAARTFMIKQIRARVQKDMRPEEVGKDSAVLNFYRDHLESYSAEFADQLNEFRQGNLLFNIMQKKIWDPASEDSVALIKFYQDHPDKYWWEQSADALIVTAPNLDSATLIEGAIKSNPSLWRMIAESSRGTILADSGRYELNQLPIVERTNFTEGLAAAPVVNPNDHTASFAYIIKLYTAREKKSFQDARGALITDYQDMLENQWIAELKKKYPVKVSQKVFKKLPVSH